MECHSARDGFGVSARVFITANGKCAQYIGTVSLCESCETLQTLMSKVTY